MENMIQETRTLAEARSGKQGTGQEILSVSIHQGTKVLRTLLGASLHRSGQQLGPLLHSPSSRFCSQIRSILHISTEHLPRLCNLQIDVPYLAREHVISLRVLYVDHAFILDQVSRCLFTKMEARGSSFHTFPKLSFNNLSSALGTYSANFFAFPLINATIFSLTISA